MLTKNSVGADLYFETLGSGEPLILSAGSGYSSLHFKQNGDAALLAEHYKVILWDYSGLGQSGRATRLKPDQWIDDIVSILDALAIERAHIAGSSMGSRVAGRFALDHPERTATLVVTGAITHIEPAGEAQLDSGYVDPAANEMRSALWQQMHGEDWLSVVTWYREMRKDPALQDYLTLRDRIGEIQAPTLITRTDKEDPVHPLAQSIDWHARARECWLWIAPSRNREPTGTFATLPEYNDQFIDLLTAFTGVVR